MIDNSQVPPRVSPQMVQQISLDAQLENVNSSFADFTQFPESVVQVRHMLIYILQRTSKAVPIFVPSKGLFIVIRDAIGFK